MTEQEELEYLKQNSPMALPDDPSSSGWSAAQIKEKHYAGLFFLYNLFKANRENLNQAVSDMQEIVDSINAEYDEIINGKNVSAKWDDENNEIKTTYAKILNITNGTIKVLKYIKENGTDDYIYNIEKNLSTLTTNFNTLKAWTDNLKDINSDTSVLRAVQATKDGLGNIINETYATIASLTLVNSSISNIVNGTTIVGKAYNDQLGRRIDTTYIRIADIINVLNDTSTNKPLSAAMGKSLQDQINAINTLLASDDTDLDTIQEIITYIKNNKTLIENITSDKMSYSVLVHNLTTNNDNLPLSASMGYVLKGYIDTLNDAETGIQANEAQRILNENQRIANEEARQTGYSGFDSRITANTNAISGIKDGTNIDSFADVESALATKANTSDVYAKSEVYTKTETQALHTDTLNSSKSYTDKRIDDLEWQMGTYNYDIDTDSNVARIKTLPSDTYKSQVDYIGGKSVKYNQLVQNGNFESDSGWTSWVYGNQYSINNNECHIYGLTNNDISRACNVPANHKCLILYDVKGNEYSTRTYFGFSNSAGSTEMKTITTSYQTISAIITTQATPTRFYIYVQGNNANNEAWIRRVEIIDLTDKFGAGNEPSTVETAIPLLKANGYKLDGTDTYSTGDLKHAITTSVVYSGTDVQDITLSIPSEVLALDGYGLGISNMLYNYIEFDKTNRKVWFNKVGGSVDLGSFNWYYQSAEGRSVFQIDPPFTSLKANTLNLLCPKYATTSDSNYTTKDLVIGRTYQTIFVRDTSFNGNPTAFKTAMNGVMLEYELATPQKIDITQYFTNLDEWFSIVLNKQYATCEMVVDEPIDMPNSITNLIKEVKA